MRRFTAIIAQHLAFVCLVNLSPPTQAAALLSVHPDNPIYFQAGDAPEAVYLSGAYAARSLQDFETHPFVFEDHVNTLLANDMNLTTLVSRVRGKDDGLFIYPTIYRRTTEDDNALDGRPRFDLRLLNDDYFERLASRVSQLHDKGIYAIYTLFNSWDGEREQHRGHLLFDYNPFHGSNNVNNIDTDTNKNGTGEELHRLPLPPAIKEIQEAYIKRVVDTLNPFPNVLYEICNECMKDSKEWQIWVIETIKNYQASKPRQHLVGMSTVFEGIRGAELAQHSAIDWWQPGPFSSSPTLWRRLLRLDWRQSSPSYESARKKIFSNPPSADGPFAGKPIIFNTDHFMPNQATVDWVWKSMTRGLHPMSYETPLIDETDLTSHVDGLFLKKIHANIKASQRFARLATLATMSPLQGMSSTGYALADPGREYLIYQPDDGAFSVDGLMPQQAYDLEWFQPSSGQTIAEENFVAQTPRHSFTPPMPGRAVLYITQR